MRAPSTLVAGILACLSGCYHTVTRVQVRDPSLVALEVVTPDGRFEVLPPSRTPEAHRLLNSVVMTGPYGGEGRPLAIDARRGPNGEITETVDAPVPLIAPSLTLLSPGGETTAPFEIALVGQGGVDPRFRLPVCSQLLPRYASGRHRSWFRGYEQALTPECVGDRLAGPLMPELVTPLSNLEKVVVEHVPPDRVHGALALPLGVIFTAGGALLIGLARQGGPVQPSLAVGATLLGIGLCVDVVGLYTLVAPRIERRVY
jgi:hypothetical protein